MWSETEDVCVATSQSTFSSKQIEGKNYRMVARWDRDKNEYSASFDLAPGTYRLFLRNFDEEMTVYIKL